ncbi:MAG: histidine ammonia-lyase [Acidimicrobiia bacterium]|nr:MAG: histidine ammonia-lyase [Acidimicrobiia bacterium]
MTVFIDGSPLTIDDVVAVANGRADVEVGDGLADRMIPALRVVRRVVANDETVYGITTGFGALATTKIHGDEVLELQADLLRSHAGAVGDLLDPVTVRAMLLLRARTLAQGHSGVRPEIVEFIVEMLRRDLTPAVPGQGSVGASGDLALFAHLALPIIGEGLLLVEGDAFPSAEVLSDAGLEPLTLEAKEGLSLLNGTEGMLARGCLAVDRGRRLADAADAACALSIEALLASTVPLDARIHQLRPHPGQIQSAATMARLLDGSEIVASHREDMVHAVQDAYSLRCAPQVHGAVRDSIEYAATVFDRELGSVVDNPIVFPDEGDVISGGNFHGQPLAIVLDLLAIAVAELGSISERRIDRILDPQHSFGLPPFLAGRPGVESGYMLAQYTAASLVAESRVLSHPASVDSIPTSGSQEDHVSMGWGSARKLIDVLDNTTLVLAVELICAAEGTEHRTPLQPAAGTAAVLAAVREHVPALDGDRSFGADIERAAEMITTGGLDSIVHHEGQR